MARLWARDATKRNLVRVLPHRVWSPIDWGDRTWMGASAAEKDRRIQAILDAANQQGPVQGLDPDQGAHPRAGGVPLLRSAQHDPAQRRLGRNYSFVAAESFAITFWAHTWRH